MGKPRTDKINGNSSVLQRNRTFLIWHLQRGLVYTMSRGYHWFHQRFMPAVGQLEKAELKKDRILLSDCWYRIGDVHDFNDCPQAAIFAYRKSFKFDNLHSEALREMAVMYERIGNYKKARMLLEKAVQLNPDDKDAASDINGLSFSGPPLFTQDDPCWNARESLAKGDPKKALGQLKNRRTVAALQIKAHASAALSDTHAFLVQWQTISKQQTPIEMTFSDWFYITEQIWDNATFWEFILNCARQVRFTYSVWPMHTALDSLFPESGRRLRQSKADLKRCNKRVRLLAQYHIARIYKDQKMAHELSQRVPMWTEAETLYKKLSSKDSR